MSHIYAEAMGHHANALFLIETFSGFSTGEKLGPGMSAFE